MELNGICLNFLYLQMSLSIWHFLGVNSQENWKISGHKAWLFFGFEAIEKNKIVVPLAYCSVLY